MGDADNSAAIKESRRVLRRVQKHLSQSLIDMGANRENIGLVDVVYHPKNKLPHINYVSPRKNAAWIPGPGIKKGLERLRELERKPRVIYIEGLYPPLFAKSIRDLGLVIEQESTIMVYKLDEERGVISQWLEYSFLSPGHLAEWHAGAVEANVWLVEYNVFRGVRSKKPRVTYRFEVDLAQGTLIGRNPAAKDLLSGGAIAPSRRPARRAARRGSSSQAPLPDEGELNRTSVQAPPSFNNPATAP